MKIAPYLAKKKLDAAVSEVSCISWLFANDPMSDFSRNRKLSVESLFRLMLKFSGKSLQSEISSYYDPPGRKQQTVPTKSAFVQQRQKLLWESCYTLFRSFTDSLPYLKLFDGYCLLACDGSSVPIPRNKNEKDYSVITREDRKSYNQLHINGLFDILNRIYVDCVIDPGMHVFPSVNGYSPVKQTLNIVLEKRSFFHIYKTKQLPEG